MELGAPGVAVALGVLVGPEVGQAAEMAAHLRSRHRRCKLCPSCLCTSHRILHWDTRRKWKHPPTHSSNTSRLCQGSGSVREVLAQVGPALVLASAPVGPALVLAELVVLEVATVGRLDNRCLRYTSSRNPCCRGQQNHPLDNLRRCLHLQTGSSNIFPQSHQTQLLQKANVRDEPW